MSLHTKIKSIIKPAIIIPAVLLFLTASSAFFLASSNSHADTTSATASVTVPDTCYMSSTSTTHTGTASGGTYTENFGGESTVTVTCNDRNGYSVYAVGYSNDIEGTNGLIGTSTGLIIPTGTSTTGSVSNWAMRLTPIAGTFAPTILNGYNNYSLVPATATKVATLTSDINVSNLSQFKTSYAVAIASNQPADTYTGKVKYTVVHPNYVTPGGDLESYPVTLGFGANTSSIVIDGITYTSSSATPSIEYGTHTISATFPSGYEFDSWSASGSVTITDVSSTSTTITVTGTGTLSVAGRIPPVYLYDTIAAMSKGTQTLAELRTAIATANSGVYEYNASVFGAASDAASTHTIYYYRGILDQTTGSYGSNGDGKAWPNYVILDANGTKDTSDTCWRIVRTTGSGGVKMIYNGKWTGSTCANATTAAQVTTQAFDTTANSSAKSIVGVGYTYNAGYKSTTTATAYSTLFGSNTSYSGNSTASTMKTYLEGTFWSTISSYESKLEKSAGYCNDRTLNTGRSWTSPMSDSTTVSTPYASASSGITEYDFGAYIRNMTTAQKPTLTCPRSNADLYTTSSATNGNKQLGKPVALLTADEVSFAGSGFSNSTTPYHANSYLSSGSNFWLFSPYYRGTIGVTNECYIGTSGNLNYYTHSHLDATLGVRPAISLVSGTTISSGSGIATDPWVVTP